MATTKKKVSKASKKTKGKKPRSEKAHVIVMTSPVSPDTRMVVAAEFADDEIIERELNGEVMRSFIYCFEQEGKKVIGLSIKGVDEVVRRLGRNPKSGSKIRVNPQYLIKEEVERNGQKGIEVSVFAEDLVTGNSAWGIKFEPYTKSKRNGGQYENTFAVEKALSKAERNAKRKLIPEVAAAKMIEKLIDESPSNMQQLSAPPQQVRGVTKSRPAPSTQEELNNMVLDAIKSAKTVDVVISIDERTQQSDKFTDAFKKAVHVACNNKVSALEGDIS